MIKKTILLLILSVFLLPNFVIVESADTVSYTTYDADIYKNTFYEYEYRMTEQYLELRTKFEVN
jgi:hypothetical protein